MMAKKTTWSDELASDLLPALGMIELNSISRGLFLTDVILKKAPVRMIASQPVSSGKHVILFFGDVASVEESYRAAITEGAGCLVRDILIPSVHEKLVPFLDSLWEQKPWRAGAGESVGIVESLSLAGAILSADRALKVSNVWLSQMRLGQGIGGKAFFVLSGRQEDVEVAVQAARECLESLDSLERTDLITRPQDEALSYF